MPLLSISAIQVTPSPEFNGIVLAVLSVDGITQKYLLPIKSGTRGYAWMMDSDGTLLYHPTQPAMVGRNLYQSNQSCFQCHKSFDAEKKMIEGKSETVGYYVAPGGETKLAAFYRFPIVRKSWIVVVSAPYSDVIALMQKSRRFYSLLIMSIFVTTLVASITTIITYKRKIKAEEKAKHLENQRRLEHEIEIAERLPGEHHRKHEDQPHGPGQGPQGQDAEHRPGEDVQPAQRRHSRNALSLRSSRTISSHTTAFPSRHDPAKKHSGRSFEIKDYMITGS